MDKTEKNLVAGAFATAGVDALSEGYFQYMNGLGKAPINQFPFITITPYLPPVDAIMAEAGTPLLLYVLGKALKKPSLVQAAKGGAVYGLGSLIGQTAYRVATQGWTVGYYVVR